MMGFSVTFFFLMFFFFDVHSTSCPNSGAIEDPLTVVTGRCILFKTIVNPTAVCAQHADLNCTSVAESFVTAFAGQDPCNVSLSRYDDFINKTRHATPKDKSLFWENTYNLVQQYAQDGLRKLSLEGTMTGYLVDRLRFCSSLSEAGGIGRPTTAFCPSFDETDNCTYNAEASFWSVASTNFAASARGTITVMLNASVSPAFTDTSYFGLWELPNLKPGLVGQADIWLVHAPGHVIRETCKSASIQRLRDRLFAKKIAATCTENPRDVLWLMCWDDNKHPECQALGGTSSGESRTLAGTGYLPVITATLSALLSTTLLLRSACRGQGCL